MTRTGDREIRSVSGRLPDNPGELARMRLAPPFVPYEMSLKSMNNKEFKTFIKTNQKSFLICVTVTNNLSKNAFQNLREIGTPLVHGKTVP